MHFRIPDPPSRLRKFLLAPATLLYAAACALHRAWPRPLPAATATPLIVIGSLRAGGAGKTPVTLALARHLASQGYRTGVLAYALPRKTAKGMRKRRDGGRGGTAELRSGRRDIPREGVREVFPDSDWRETSDEAVLLARNLHADGVRVFVTRDRAQARAALARDHAFDVLVSDDGLMDARLRDHRGPHAHPSAARRVLRVALARRGERPGLWDLLPAGPWRLTASALDTVDIVLREGEDYARTLLPPARGFSRLPPVWALTGLAAPQNFLRSLKNAGVVVRGATHGADHSLPDPERALRDAERAGTTHFICTGKDWIKLETHPRRPPVVHCVNESVILYPRFLAQVASFLRAPTS